MDIFHGGLLRMRTGSTLTAPLAARAGNILGAIHLSERTHARVVLGRDLVRVPEWGGGVPFHRAACDWWI